MINKLKLEKYNNYLDQAIKAFLIGFFIGYSLDLTLLLHDTLKSIFLLHPTIIILLLKTIKIIIPGFMLYIFNKVPSASHNLPLPEYSTHNTPPDKTNRLVRIFSQCLTFVDVICSLLVLILFMLLSYCYIKDPILWNAFLELFKVLPPQNDGVLPDFSFIRAILAISIAVICRFIIFFILGIPPL